MKKKKAKKASPRLVVKRLPIKSLSLDPSNARIHRERNLESIKGSLARFELQKPIVIDQNRVIVAGNGTYLAAKELGWTHLECVQTKLSESERTAFAIADNRTAELAEWDFDVLGSILKSMKDETAQLAAGFTQEEVQRIVSQLTPEFTPTDGEAPRLDTQNTMVCPKCGHEFDRPAGAGRQCEVEKNKRSASNDDKSEARHE